MKSSIHLAILNDYHECAKMVYEKFVDAQLMISTEPFSHVYFERYFNLAKHLENTTKSSYDRKKRDQEMRNINVFKKFLFHIFIKNETPRSISEQSETKKDFECPVCFEDMVYPRKIYSCFNGHYICSVCLSNPRIQKCPICRDDFYSRKPKRCLEAEEKVKKLFDALC